MLNNQDMEAAWGALCGTVYIEPTHRQHKDCFAGDCDEIMQLLEDPHHVYKAYLDDPTSTAKKDALRMMYSTSR